LAGQHLVTCLSRHGGPWPLLPIGFLCRSSDAIRVRAASPDRWARTMRCGPRATGCGRPGTVMNAPPVVGLHCLRGVRCPTRTRGWRRVLRPAGPITCIAGQIKDRATPSARCVSVRKLGIILVSATPSAPWQRPHTNSSHENEGLRTVPRVPVVPHQ